MFHHSPPILPPVGSHETNPFGPPPTTLIGCSKCGGGWPPKYMVLGLCRDCAKKELLHLRDYMECCRGIRR